MTVTETRHKPLRNDLYIRSEELPGTPAIHGAAVDDIESNADQLVRQLLIEEKRRTMPDRLPPIAPQEEVLTYDPMGPELRRERPQESIAQILKAERAGADGTGPRGARFHLPAVRLPKMRLPRLRRAAVPTPGRNTCTKPVAAEIATPSARWPSAGSGLARRVMWYRPTRKHIALAAVAALVLYRPLMVPLLALVAVWVVLIAYLTLGPDRWTEILVNAWLRLQARRPELAERVRLRADRFAEGFDRVLDRLPEAWAERLALPDFTAHTQMDEDAPDPFDRLAAEARRA
ncbi:MAG: hypothetical protein ACE369_17790 [Roseovarius sp.]